tara:strand:+ start:731 stop:1111 length:381 start_codon:yes stop_codon:yes gene_type:complete
MFERGHVDRQGEYGEVNQYLTLEETNDAYETLGAAACGKRPADWIHMTDYFQLVRRIVATSDAIGMVAKQFTENSWFRANFVALEGIGLFDPLTLCYAVRSRWQVKPAGRALVSLVRQAWRTASSD